MDKRITFIFVFMWLFVYCFGIYATENEYFKKGLSLYQKNEFDMAVVHFEEAKKIEPQDSQIYFYLGNSYYQLDNIDSAISNFTAGLNFSKDKGPFFYNLGNCYYLKGNYNFSSEMYSKAIENDPTLYDAYLNTGNAHFRAGYYEGTITQWETYLEKHPQTVQYEKIERAIAYLKEQLQNASQDGGSSLNDGQAGDQTSAQDSHTSSGSQSDQTDSQGDGLDDNINGATGLDMDLLNDVLSDLEEIANQTENVMEISEKPIDDLTSEEIER
jgi:tetratricopeptide (TPR) repeat protein